MKTSIKRFISFLVVTTLLLSSLPMAFANSATSFTDFPTGWSAPAMTAAINNGLLTGFEDGTIRPEDKLTRAEVATIITRAFGAQTTADISAFADVPADAWFYPYIARAVKMGALNGTSATTMEPDISISREQVFTAVARVLVLSSTDTSVLSKFNDAGSISSWAVPYMAALVERGYINGDTFGNVNPQADITREEFAQFMYNAIRTYITQPGTYNTNLEGITVLRVGGVTLEKLSATSDLVLGDGVGTGVVKLNNVKIEKRLLARGGTITLTGTKTGAGVVVNNVNGVTHFNNYRTEAVFAGIVENTVATFLKGGGSYREPTTYYTLNFYIKSTDLTPKYTVRIAKDSTLGGQLPTPAAEDIVGYRFQGWFKKTDSSAQVTGSTPITGDWELVAKLERIDYPVSFKNEDGTTAFSYFDNYTPVATANVEEPYILPTATNIKRNGYTFNGWTDLSGNPVTSIAITASTPESGFVLKPNFTKDTYYVEFYNEDGTSAQFIPTYMAPTQYAVDNLPTLPTAAEVVPQTGTFAYWKDAQGTPVYALTVTDEMEDGDILKLYAHTSPALVNKYPVNFYLRDGDLTPYASFPEVVEGTSFGASLPTPAADDIVGYRFRGWFVGATQITETTPITGPLNPVAKLERIDYPVSFKNEDGTTAFSYFDNYTPVATANVEETYVLPTAANVKRLGYTFNGWTDLSGNPVTAITITATTPETGFVLIADVTKHTYYVKFYNEDGTPAQFVSDYTAPTWYAVDFKPSLPSDSKVVVASDQLFRYWRDVSGNPVYSLSVTEGMQDGDILALYAHTEPVPINSYTVSFYEGYGTQSEWMKNVTAAENSTVAKTDIPAIGPRKVSGYSENGTVASVYAGNEYTHVTVPTYWYPVYTFICADCGHAHESTHAPEACANCSATSDRLNINGKAKLMPFDETVTILGDLNVYLLYQRFGLYLNYDETGLALAITAAYEEDTRLMDSVKDLVVSAGNQLDAAIRLDQIPNYDKAVGELKDRLVAAGVIDADKNIQILYLPISISSVVKEDTANNMVKQYIRDVINDPARLDSLLNMIDLPTLVKQMDMTELINGLSDQEIADIIGDTNNQTEVINFIVSDLQSTNPKMLSMIVNFIQTNATFREQMIDDLMIALMDKNDTSSLKNQAITHLKTLLNTDGSSLQTQFLDMLMDSLTGTNPDTELQQTVINEIKASDSLKSKFADMLIEALKSDNDADPLKQLAIDQIKTNATVQGLIVDSLVADLKAGTASSSVIGYIRSSDELVDMIITALKDNDPSMMTAMTDYFKNNLATNTNLLNSLTTTVQTNLSADTEDGKKLRDAILTSGELLSLLKDNAMKSSVIDMLLTVSFIDKVLVDSTFRTDLIEAAVGNQTFVDFLVNTDEFATFILPEIREGGSLASTITGLIQNAGTFVHEVLEDVKDDDAFLALVKEGGALRSEVLGKIDINDYIVSEEDLLKYIFNQGGHTGDYSFINSADLDSFFKTEYEKRPEAQTTPFETLTPEELQNIKNSLYAEDEIRSRAIAEIESHFEEYKADVLDKLVAKNDLTDPEIESLINDLLVDYIERYIAKDTTLNTEAETVIEGILLAYVRQLMTRTDITDNDLNGMKDDVLALKTSFVSNAANLSTITTIVEDFVSTKPTETRAVIESAYDDLAEDLVALIQTNTSVYTDVENKLKTITVSASVLQNFITNNSASETVKDLLSDYFSDAAADAAKRAEVEGYIQQCLATMTDTELAGHIQTFLATSANETSVKTKLYGYVSGMDDADLRAELKLLASNPNDAATIKTHLITAIGTMDNAEILKHLDTFISTNEADVRALALDEVKTMTDAEIADYLATFLNKSTANQAMVEGEVRSFLNDPQQSQSVVDFATSYLTNANNETQIRTYLADFLNTVDATFVNQNRSTIIEALNAIDLSGIVDADMVKQYINRLTDDGKISFSNKVFDALKNAADYQAFMHDLMNNDTFKITSSNVGMIQAVAGAIRNLDYDLTMSLTENATVKKLIDVLGDAFLRDYFNTMKNDYCDGLDEAIEKVKNGSAEEQYTTSLTLRINPMELLKKLYDKAQPEIEERLRNAGIRYDENIYLKYLVEHDILAALFNGNETLASGDFTGYQLKDVMDYYNYLVSLLIVADDALCWYGDSANVTEAEFDAVYDAVFGKIYDAHSKLNDILETYESEGKLPAQVQSLVDQVQQINALLTRFDSQLKVAINKYLGSSVNDKLENGTIHENDKVQRVVDLLIGSEKPIFNINSLYAIFYQYDDNVQAKLKELIDSGKLKAAIDKFEATDFGKLFKGDGRFGTVADKLEEIKNTGKVQSAFDSIYDVLVVLAEEGIDVYRAEQDDVTVIDSYQVTVGGVNLKIKRYYQ